ncbi:MAG: response regulator [bacterium]|nr:response regulator [bacterium]
MTSSEQDRGKILVADDDAAVQLLLGRLLKMKGFSVVPAVDGPSVVEALRSHGGAIRLVLLDLTMPGMSGIEMMRQIREVRPDVPVFVMTGHREGDILSQLDPGEITGFLGKPFQPPELLAKIQQALGDD